MAKKTIADVDVAGLRVFMRVDFNVPLDAGGNVTDDLRIQQALPTIKNVLDRGGRLILVSHLGRPKGEAKPEFSLAPAAKRLGELLGRDVPLAPDCVGEAVEQMVAAMADGDVIVLENVRFHKDEEKPADDSFARQLAAMADVYCNDAFGTCHRKHTSMYGVPKVMEGRPRVLGLLVAKELKYLGDAVGNPARPFVAILGGAKVSGKIKVVESLLGKVDVLMIGGAMSYPILKARGVAIGNSLAADEDMEFAEKLVGQAAESKAEFLLPVDHVAGREFAEDTETAVQTPGIEDGWMGLDIGPETVAAYCEKIASAGTVVWNGPVGKFEWDAFSAGTRAIAQALADSDATSIIGGGDSAAAVRQMGFADRVSHISTGGGASLEFLEGRPFETIEILDEA